MTTLFIELALVFVAGLLESLLIIIFDKKPHKIKEDQPNIIDDNNFEMTVKNEFKGMFYFGIVGTLVFIFVGILLSFLLCFEKNESIVTGILVLIIISGPSYLFLNVLLFKLKKKITISNDVISIKSIFYNKNIMMDDIYSIKFEKNVGVPGNGGPDKIIFYYQSKKYIITSNYTCFEMAKNVFINY